MSTQSILGLGQHVEIVAGEIQDILTKTHLKTAKALIKELAEQRKAGEVEIEALRADLPPEGNKWHAIAVKEIEEREAALVVVPDEAKAGEMLAEMNKALFVAFAQRIVALQQLSEVVVPVKGAGGKAQPLATKVNQGRVYFNDAEVPAFSMKDGTIIIPHASALPEGHEAHASGATLVGHLRDGKFYTDKRFVEEFNTVSGLMKAVLGEKAQGINNTPFTANDGARGGRVISRDELAALVS